jgi:hypothetical protein
MKTTKRPYFKVTLRRFFVLSRIYVLLLFSPPTAMMASLYLHLNRLQVEVENWSSNILRPGSLVKSSLYSPFAMQVSRRVAHGHWWHVQYSLLRHWAERRISSEHAGCDEGSCVTSRQFHEAILRVIVSPIWGPALCHHGWSGTVEPLSLLLNLDGVVVCAV